MTITLPTVHLNGTSKTDLRAEYDAAADALHGFVQKWGAITCNGRDYYVQGPDAYGKARDEREAMGKNITEVINYLQAVREHLYA